jgi:hypothetical protein
VKYKELSEVRIKILETLDEKFKGQIIEPDGEKTNTVASAKRETAITNVLSEARAVLLTDNSGSRPSQGSRSGE